MGYLKTDPELQRRGTELRVKVREARDWIEEAGTFQDNPAKDTGL